ncbi:hypothetical protein HK101_000918 [Irineochytrium annulatum]|nr:hypothetical protein HK101_000918 [Irineochytrium annulatum]
MSSLIPEPILMAVKGATLFVLLEGVSLCINVVQVFSFPLLMVDHRLYRNYIRVTERLFASLMVLLTYLLMPVHLSITGDTSGLKASTSTLLISNHQTLLDWWYIWLLCWTRGAHGEIKIILKESLRWLPIVGWGMRFFEFIFLSRKISIDKERLEGACAMMRGDKGVPYWLLIFPEGTVLDRETRPKCLEYAEKMNLKEEVIPTHTLIPRSTGLRICMRGMKVRWIEDVTVGFEAWPGWRMANEEYVYDRFAPLDAFLRRRAAPRRVHFYVRRFPVEEIPGLEDGADEEKSKEAFDLWVRERYLEKDAMMRHFDATGQWPDERTVMRKGHGQSEEAVAARLARIERCGAKRTVTEVVPTAWEMGALAATDIR